MKLPFSLEQFLQVFEDYNRSVWPLQFFFYLLAILAIFSAFNRTRFSGKIIYTILGFFWIWMGVVYHIIYFSPVNKAALFFGIAFILQGILFFYTGYFKKMAPARVHNDVYGVTGQILIGYALVIYPVAGFLLGHVYPASPTFGLPCPTTIFTFGILLLADKKPFILLLIIPLIWSIIGTSAAFSLGIKEDTGLIIAGLLFITLSILRKKTRTTYDANRI